VSQDQEAMMKTKIAVALATLAGISALAPLAHADPPKNARDYAYEFTDDSILGVDGKGTTPIIRVRAKGRRDLLHRPRVQFVQEMLKSVENM
jgi:hypothetical protein